MIRTDQEAHREDREEMQAAGGAEAGAAGEMVFAPVGREEREVVARLDAETRRVHLNSAWPVYSRRFQRFYGPPSHVTRNHEGEVTTCSWEIPLGLVTFRRPRNPGSGNPTGLARLRAP